MEKGSCRLMSYRSSVPYGYNQCYYHNNRLDVGLSPLPVTVGNEGL